MTSTRSVFLAGMIGMVVGLYVGITMQHSPASRQIRMTSENLWRRARGLVQGGANSWVD
ncbi:MAG TPA: hypothetical protein GX008_05185 [Firmicutes bacterium]|jgi:ABC-type nitrate/sulfonate/bicarbonate transport system permease component|nr:hypothetical protein [Bacillota bacterium]